MAHSSAELGEAPMSAPTTTNATATTVDAGIKAAGSGIVGVAEGMIIAAQPWLGWPGIKQIWEALFSWIASYFEKAAATGATFVVIDVQVGSEETKMSAALAALVAAEKSGNADAIKTAIQVYANTQSTLVHDDGSSTAQ